MSSRPVFEIKEVYPYYNQVAVAFEWSRGMSLAQWQRNSESLHAAYLRNHPDDVVLEVSRKSTSPLGNSLSAFNLTKQVPSLNKSLPVECIYQGGKVFTNGGPYLDLLEASPRDAKSDPRVQDGFIVGFQFEGNSYPTYPKTIFYDWLYINALLENGELLEELCRYTAFTDIVFNPEKSAACQARSVAIAVSLSKAGLIDKVRDFAEFARLMGSSATATEVNDNVSVTLSEVNDNVSDVQINKNSPATIVGAKIEHVKFGKGEVLEVEDGRMKVGFADGSEKTLNIMISISKNLIKLP